jgi:adenylylsulfate kinase
MLQTAAYLLIKDAGLKVLLDGRTFSRRYQRERVFEFCRQVGTTWATLECVCAEQTALGRLAEAVGAKHPPRRQSHGGAISQNTKGVGDNRQPKLLVDTDASLESCVDLARRYLNGEIGI